MHAINRVRPPAVALETTILVHGLPRQAARDLHDAVLASAAACGVQPCLIGVVGGAPTIGLSGDELETLFAARRVEKLNTANLGIAIHRNQHGATTVSSTVELAAAAGIRVFATGGIGGVHQNYAADLDISADLFAIARYPVAVVASGCKNVLDVSATREALETLGVPVVGFCTDAFPAFYQRQTDPPIGIDADFHETDHLAEFVAAELDRTGRGILVVNPIPAEDEIPLDRWSDWISDARAATSTASGRDVTPALLSRVHALSNGQTTRANLALARSNADLACRLAARMHRS